MRWLLPVHNFGQLFQYLNISMSIRSPLLHRNHADLDVDGFGQGRYLNGFSCREIAGKVLAINFVDLAELVHVGDEDGGLDHVVEAHAGFSQDGFQVLHHLVGFVLDVAVFQVAGLRVNANLPGDV